MALTDTTEYWWDVKSTSNKRTFTHAEGLVCGHYHKSESNELNDIDCYACKELIEADPILKNELEANNGKREAKRLLRRRKKKGFKLSTTIWFGKYKGNTIEWIINNDKSYFNWLRDNNVILLHPELNDY